MPSAFAKFAGFLLVLLVAFARPMAPTFAQDAAAAAKDMAPIIEQAKKSGMTVLVLSPEADVNSAEKPEQRQTMSQRAFQMRHEIRDILAVAPTIPSAVKETLKKASPDGNLNWLWQSILLAVAGIVAGTLLSRLFRRFAMNRLAHVYNPDPKTRTEKIGYLLFRATLISFNCVLMFATAMLVALLFDFEHDESRSTITIIVASYVAYWVFRAVIFFNIIAHDLPKHRMINLDDESAERMQRDWRNSMIVVIVAFAGCEWMRMLGIDPKIHKLFLIVAMALAAIILGALFIRHRKPFAGVILGAGDPVLKPIGRRILAANWHILAVLYLAVAWLVSSYRLVMNLPNADLLVAAPAIAFIAALPVYGIVLIAIDRFYMARRDRFEERVAAAAREAEEARRAEERAFREAVASDPKAIAEAKANPFSPTAPDSQFPVFQPLFKPLLEQAAGILITIFATGFVLDAWEVHIGDRGNPVTAFMDTIMVAFIAWFLYRLVVTFVDERLKAEGEYVVADPTQIEDEPSGKGSSRLGTLLPLIRNVAIATILVISGMIVLSNLGVDIAPLFAGAGVIGLAVGFGAQTLIRDIFSGGFFLFDDAFRKGEYVEIGNTRGTIEKISLRSFQLRHHNGPLHTIPFGEIQQLTNYSRDWVIMKLPLRVTYDTDVEKVRKLIKKLGQQLLSHPDVGANFLQPLKSQGVVQMEDSAMILRVKFMTRPGDQWVTRKVVYASIRELFEREGIRFASREVTVRIADESAKAAQAHQVEAAAAAARSIVDAEMEELGADVDGPGGDDR